MSIGEVLGLVFGAVAAPLLVAAVLGLVKWGLAANKLLGQVTELVKRVGQLTELSADTALLRAEFVAHCKQAEERWTLALGRDIPEPREPYPGERRRHPRVLEAGT